jgi:hypothetical protein
MIPLRRACVVFPEQAVVLSFGNDQIDEIFDGTGLVDGV